MIVDQLIHVACLTALVLALCKAGIHDHKRNQLPDRITLPLLWCGLLLNLEMQFALIDDAVLGAASGYVAVRVMHDYRLARNCEPGIGLGDAKMLASLGAWFGWKLLAPLVVVATLITLAIYARQQRPMPLGVGLSASGSAIAVWEMFY